MASGISFEFISEHQERLTVDNGTSSTVLTESEVDTWFLMSRPWPVLAIAAFYLGFVLKLGPALMRQRRPLELRSILLCYNGAHVIFSTWWIYKAFSDISLSNRLSCRTQSVIDELDQYHVNSLMWYYLMSKFVELLDTVFFVLRKKQSQVSFLHVYHHTNMSVFTWAFLKYVRGSQFLMIGCVNSAVHAIMYGYYFAAALGPKVQNYLSLIKPLITWIQMGQFVILIGYLVLMLAFGCDVPRRFTQFCVTNTGIFLVLFMNFYRQTYMQRKCKTGISVQEAAFITKTFNEGKPIKVD